MPAADVLAATGEPASRAAEAGGRLVVAWQHPTERSIQPVGFLTRTAEGYAFSYIKNALGVPDFRPLLGFDDLYRAYRSEDLFPLFAQRAMDPRRTDYHRYVSRLGLEGEPGPWEQIARSQGRREGDTIQLFPEPTVDGDEVRCLFLVHGMRYAHRSPKILAGAEVAATRDQIDVALAKMRPGDELGIIPEPENDRNPLAVVVTATPHEPLIPVGWVPDLLVEDLHRLMSRARVVVTAEHVNHGDAPWHLRLLARLSAAPAPGFGFFTSERWDLLA